MGFFEGLAAFRFGGAGFFLRTLRTGAFRGFTDFFRGFAAFFRVSRTRFGFGEVRVRSARFDAFRVRLAEAFAFVATRLCAFFARARFFAGGATFLAFFFGFVTTARGFDRVFFAAVFFCFFVGGGFGVRARRFRPFVLARADERL